MTELGVFFIVATILGAAFVLWVRYSETHPKKK